MSEQQGELEQPELEQPVPAVEAAAEEAAVPVATVGQTLRAAREAASLSLSDVAQSLKFSPRQIELIEADDYAALPGNTVVRGFTRSYARLLRLDPEELVRLLDNRTPLAPAEVRPPDNMGIASDGTDTRQLTPVVSATIVIALAALLLGVWHFFGPSSQPAQAVAPAEAPAVSSSAEPPAPALPAATSDSEAPAGAPAESGMAPATVPAASSALPALLFVFEDRSWLEVADASKQTLHTGENLAGTRLTLGGKPPFDIVVGNASKVKLTYGEREIDLAPHTRADVARFKLE